jgi:transposase InsO family protein
LDLKDVWLVPEFGSIRLISTKALNKDGIAVLLENGKATGIKNQSKVFETANCSELYILESTEKALESTTNPEVKEPTEILPETQNPSESAADLWHRRLGHTNHRDIKKLRAASTGMAFIPKIKTDGENSYDSCLAGKMKESFHKKTDSRATKRLRRLHADISGVLPLSIRGFQYYLLVTDDATRCSWVRFLKTKETTEILPHLKQLKAELEKETGDEIAFVWADNGKGEFGQEFKNYLRELGIQIEHSPPYKHSLNGVIERAIGTVSWKARSMLYEAKLFQEYWCLGIQHPVYLKNRIPTVVLPYEEGILATAITPYEAYKGTIPKLTSL